MPPPIANRSLLFALITALISLGMVESAAFVTLHLARQRAPERFVPDWNNYVVGIKQDAIDHLNRHYFDALLGWNYQPGFRSERRNSRGQIWRLSIGSHGSRVNPGFSDDDPIQIATYGDSFTFGDEVNDDQTWQYYLSQMINMNVANFGVGGYGPDQMLLKYERASLPGDSPRFVILAIYEGDLNRALTRFYPLYAPESKLFLGFKPRYVLDSNARLRLIRSPGTAPVRDQAEFRRLIDAAREHDAWYERRVEIAFPYTWGALKLARLLRTPPFGRPWASETEAALLRAIVERFVALARSRGQRPVLMFIPRVQSWRQGRSEPPYRPFVARLRREHRDLLTIDLAEASFDPARFNIAPFEGHASAYGNLIIARHVAKSLAPLITRWSNARAGDLSSSSLTKD